MDKLKHKRCFKLLSFGDISGGNPYRVLDRLVKTEEYYRYESYNSCVIRGGWGGYCIFRMGVGVKFRGGSVNFRMVLKGLLHQI